MASVKSIELFKYFVESVTLAGVQNNDNTARDGTDPFRYKG
jgi:hypothetical protein